MPVFKVFPVQNQISVSQKPELVKKNLNLYTKAMGNNSYKMLGFWPALKEIWELFFTFAKIGTVTFGGGLSMLPILERELIDKKGWATKEQLLDYYAIGQITPGIIAVNVATFIGYNRRGILGGIFATLGIVFPSLVIITIIYYFLSAFSDNVYVEKAFTGINIAVAALLTKAVVSFGKNTFKSFFAVCCGTGTFILIEFFDVNIVLTILLCAFIGIIRGFILNKINKTKAEK